VFAANGLLATARPHAEGNWAAGCIAAPDHLGHFPNCPSSGASVVKGIGHWATPQRTLVCRKAHTASALLVVGFDGRLDVLWADRNLVAARQYRSSLLDPQRSVHWPV